MISKPTDKSKLKKGKLWLIVWESSFYKLQPKMQSMSKKLSPLCLLKSNPKYRVDLELLMPARTDMEDQALV